uniref:GON-4-like protein n=1 Tax=Caenorhabditis tropicalis TaxID=1561998 RepID=A0A1I7TD87_9PELO
MIGYLSVFSRHQNLPSIRWLDHRKLLVNLIVLKKSEPSLKMSHSDSMSSKRKYDSISSMPFTSFDCSEPSTSSKTHDQQYPAESHFLENKRKKLRDNSLSESSYVPIDQNQMSGRVHYFDGHTNSSFPIPPTPGRRTPDADDHDFMDLESNSLMWTQSSFQFIEGNPRTPGSFAEGPKEYEPTDFSSINTGYAENDLYQIPSSSCQQPMGCTSQIQESSTTTSRLKEPPSTCYESENSPEVVIEDELSIPGLDMVPRDYEEEIEEVINESVAEEEVPIKSARQNNSRPPLRYKKEMDAGIIALKASRKRTRIEREAMGSVGLNDEALHERQKNKVMQKVVDEINQKLFMHKNTHQRFRSTITNDKISDIEKVSRVILILANHPELLNLVLLYAPPESVISDFESNTNYHSYKAAIEMIMDIARYITAANLKEPTLRGLFRYIRSFLEDNSNITDEQATRRFYQLFGQDRPLWNKLESQFWCLPFKSQPRLDSFEYVDLTNVDSLTKRGKRDLNSITPRFETIDDIDQVLGFVYRPLRNDPPSKLVVKCGEMCIRNDDETFTQLEITEKRWTRKDDITLLTSYNEALKKDPHFKDSMMPSCVPELPFGEKSIVARLNYLLAELKAFEDN